MKDSNLLNEVDDYTSCHNTLHQAVTTTSMVEFPDLKEIYEKVQSRAGGGSHQRVACGTINIKATSEGQLCDMNVFVQRMPEAAALCGDVNGRIPLEVNHEDYFQNQVGVATSSIDNFFYTTIVLRTRIIYQATCA